MRQAGVEAAQSLVDRSADDHAWCLKPLPERNPPEPVVQDPAAAGFERADALPVSVGVHRDVAAKRRPDVRPFDEMGLHRAVETLAHRVVPVEDVHDLTARALDAGAEVVHVTRVAALAEEFDPAAPELLDDLFGIVRRVVVNDLDLHLVGTGILGEHRAERLPKVTCAVVGRDHHRPERTCDAVRQGIDPLTKRTGLVHHAPRGKPKRSGVLAIVSRIVTNGPRAEPVDRSVSLAAWWSQQAWKQSAWTTSSSPSAAADR